MQFGTAQVYDDAGHPNRMKFSGVLVRLDEPSTKAPEGSNGHRIWMPTEVAQRRLKTLIGMGLNYSSTLSGHAQRHKVGVIEKAWIDGKDLHVSGTVWKHDFPEAERDLKQQGLGMSMELGDVDVESESADIWKLKDFCFLGATILWKKAAAYYRTLAIAAAAKTTRGDKSMATTTKKKAPVSIDIKKLVEMAASAAAEKTAEALKPELASLATSIADVATRQDALELAAAGTVTDEDEITAAGKEMCTCEMKGGKHAEGCAMNAAGKKKEEDDEDEDEDEDDDDEMDASKFTSDIKTGDLEDMSTEDPDDDMDDPGHLNKDATNKGNKTTSEDKVGKTVSTARLAASLKANKALAAQVAVLTSTTQKLKKRLAAQGKQISAATNDMNRRSVVPLDNQLTGLLAKHGINASEVQASGQKFTVTEVDTMLAGIPGLDNVARMTIKNRFLQADMMDQGAVSRGIGY